MTDPLAPRSRPGRCVGALFLGIIIVVAVGPAEAESPADFTQRAEALIAGYAADGIISGAVIVAEDGKPLLRRAYGLANREWGTANTPETRFRIASLTKQITASAILRLAEAGLLDLDASASRYVTDLPPSWSPMTLKMLLDHTSGLPNITALPDYPGVLSRIEATPRAMVARLEREALLFPPGTSQEYSNTGYILLALVIERVTGKRFAQHVEEAIFAPLRLSSTADADPGRILPRRATGYRRAGGEWRNAAPISVGSTAGAGGLVSTVDDLVAWDRALLSGKVVSAASLAAMTRDDGYGYGYGFYLGTAFGHRLWSHGGFIDGFTAIKDTYPDLGLTIVVLANTETAPAQTISRALGALYFGIADPAQNVRIAVPALARYVGFYRLDPRRVAAVTQRGGHLFLTLPGKPRLALEPESDRTFVTVGGTRITFNIEPDGRATGALLSDRGGESSGPRLDNDSLRRRIAKLTPRDLTDRGQVSPMPAERQRR